MDINNKLLIVYAIIGGLALIGLIFGIITSDSTPNKMTLHKWNKVRKEKVKDEAKGKDCYKKICALIDQVSDTQFFTIRNTKLKKSNIDSNELIASLTKRYSFLYFDMMLNKRSITIRWKVKEVNK